MSNRTLVITWKPDVLHMVEHNGSHKRKKVEGYYTSKIDNNYKGLTARSERESFRNIKTKKAAESLINRRNKKEILVAKWRDEIIYSHED